MGARIHLWCHVLGHAETRVCRPEAIGPVQGGRPGLVRRAPVRTGGRAPSGKMRPMAAMKDRLRTDLTAAMKARDDVTVRTLRMALTSVTKEEVAGSSARELSDDEVLAVLTKEAKRRREAADAFAAAGREQQAAAERAEGAVLDAYLPAQLTDAELGELVAAAIEETGASGPRAMGQVMKALTPRVAGRAEGARVAAEVRRRLGG